MSLGFQWSEHSELLLLGIAVLCHGLLILNRGYYWDGWPADAWHRSGRWAAMRRFFSEVGMPEMFWLRWAMGSVRNPRRFYAVSGFLTIYLQSLLVSKILVETQLVSSEVALVVAVIMLVYPAVWAYQDLAIVPQYLIPLTFYFMGLWCAVRSVESESVLLWHLAALPLFWVGFYCNSILVFHLGCMVLLGIWTNSIFNIADYFLLPFFFWWVKERFSPRHGIYRDYNRVDFQLWHYISGFLDVVRNPFYYAIRDSMEWTLRRPVAAVGVVGWLLVLVYFGDDRWIPREKVLVGMVCSGVWLLGCGAFPYLAAGKSFIRKGLFTRYALLFPLPIALILVGGVGLFARGMNVLFPLGTMIFGFLGFCFVDYFISIHLRWEAHAAKYEAVIQHLRRGIGASNLSIIGVKDRALIPEMTNETSTMAWTYLFEKTWGGMTRLGVYNEELHLIPMSRQVIQERVTETTLGYDLGDISIEGRQGTIEILPGSLLRQGGEWAAPTMIGIQYLRKRLFQPTRLSDFLDSLVEIRVHEGKL
jgi:hypothetical protein